jgi:hypothetical protein
MATALARIERGLARTYEKVTGRSTLATLEACPAVPRTTLTPAVRAQLPRRLFADPFGRRYPIHDEYHAKLALTHLLRVAGRHGSFDRATAATVLDAVKKRWPDVYRCEADLVSRIKRLYKLSGNPGHPKFHKIGKCPIGHYHCPKGHAHYGSKEALICLKSPRGG